MYLLKKAHIGEVQASVWPDSMIEICDKANIKVTLIKFQQLI